MSNNRIVSTKALFQKNGPRGWKVIREDTGKKPIINNFTLPDEIDNATVDVKFEGGQLIEVAFNGKIFTPKRHTPPSKGIQVKGNKLENPKGSKKSNNKLARAPYNFVPLNEEIVPSNGSVDHSFFQKGCYSGYIDLQLTTKSPFFIRKTIDEKMGEEVSEFFNYERGKYVVPGSSMRGLIASIVNVISYGKFIQFENKTLYRRSTLIEDKDEVKAGFLFMTNDEYKIRPAIYKQIKGFKIGEFQYKYNVKNNKCTFGTGNLKGVKVWEFTLQENQNEIKVDRKVVSGYQSDKNRAEHAVNLIESIKLRKIVSSEKKQNQLKEISFNGGTVKVPSNIGIPVFYRLGKNNKVESFGHAKWYRLPYEKSIADHVKQNEIKEPDFNETIFGSTRLASKVYFEDLHKIGDLKLAVNQPTYYKLLSSPKPTSYQMYLEQSSGDLGQNAQKKWSDESTKIRGYKSYWHKRVSNRSADKNSWVAEKQIKTTVNPNPIKPLTRGSEFQGRIRFNNLTKEELGALLVAVDLPEECSHKLGMGKPLGLGSIKLKTSLILINRKKRYGRLLTEEGNWNLGIDDSLDISYFKNKFVQYMAQKLEHNYRNIEDYWESNDQMIQFKILLTLSHDLKDWMKRTRYQTLEEFKKRWILPIPEKVVNPNAYSD